MKNKFWLVLFSLIITTILITSCSLTTQTSNNIQSEITKQTKYYMGMWHNCVVDTALSPNSSMGQAVTHCTERLKYYVDNDWYTTGRGINANLPAKESEFKSELEYYYYLGVWEQCFSDVASMQVLTDQQMMDFCSANLKSGIVADWYSEKDSTFPKMPTLKLKNETQG